MPPRKKPTAKLEPDQHRVCLIVKWTETDLDEMHKVLLALCNKLVDNNLADEVYLSLNNKSVVNHRKAKGDDTRL